MKPSVDRRFRGGAWAAGFVLGIFALVYFAVRRDKQGALWSLCGMCGMIAVIAGTALFVGTESEDAEVETTAELRDTPTPIPPSEPETLWSEAEVSVDPLDDSRSVTVVLLATGDQLDVGLGVTCKDSKTTAGIIWGEYLGALEGRQEVIVRFPPDESRDESVDGG